MLRVADEAGTALPLKATTVNAEIDGYGARVMMRQTFTNSSKVPIEAIYTFPMENSAAVNRMRIRMGERIIEAVVRRREEARRIYEEARNQGRVAALLDQERTNIFTQHVANIMPGATIQIEIEYVQVVPYKDGVFEFVVPTTIGPRFLGNTPDPAKVAPPATRGTGNQLSITVHGVATGPLASVESPLFPINTQQNGNRFQVKLAKSDEIPNRDFILRYKVPATQISEAFVTHFDQRGGHFALALNPPARPAANQIAPREMLFVMDQSGSQSGFPIEKSKEVTIKLIERLRPNDRFNVFGFSNQTTPLWREPRAVTPENLSEAIAHVKAMHARGGTHLVQAVKDVLATPADPARLRMVVFNTDGFIGNDVEAIESVRASANNARMFVFGIGNSVNRMVVDGMAREGRGEVEVVTLGANADEAAARLVHRLDSPVVTNLEAKFSGPGVLETMPRRLPDLFAAKPIIIYGRYERPGSGSVTLTGQVAGRPWSRTVPLTFGSAAEAPSVPTLWARAAVESLQLSAFVTRNQAAPSKFAEQITQLGLRYGIMTDYTSMVAVEQRVINVGGKPRTVIVPVEEAHGVEARSNMAVPASAAMSAGRGTTGATGATGATGGTGATGATGATGGGGAGQGRLFAGNSPGTFARSGQPIYLSWDSGQKKKALPEKLAKAKGSVEVMVLLTKWDAKTIAAIEKLGLKVEARDAKLKALFGEVAASKLAAILKLAEVHEIRPL